MDLENTCQLLTVVLLGLLFGPEDEGRMFLEMLHSF
jgi:hypothetical protein